MKRIFFLKALILLAFCATLSLYGWGQETGLLFYHSGDKGFEADYAAGNALPNYLNNVEIARDGAYGPYLHCLERQVLSYWAPRNIYAQRGTLSFFWRASTPFTETEFPIFRVGYADHSSWDMVFLRIDYNGHGFDAFVTDANLARIRTSYTLPKLPDPSQWLHFAVTWDETEGIRFYIDGQKVGQRDTTVVLNAGLDQFGPHSRIISPYQVQSAYNFTRGGDIDEIRIYDRALDGQQVATLARNERSSVGPFERHLADPRWRDEWNLRYGWNRPGDLPPYLENEATTVRKVQILEAYDLKRWWWKANDGIRETTWPGVYNRSRIIGRNDYFQLPDWDCYSTSGRQIRFNMPDEPWNYLEVSGGADGKIAITPNSDGTGAQDYFVRPNGNERSFHKLEKARKGETVVFTNNEQETPIGEFDAFYLHQGDAPEGMVRLQYTLTSNGNFNNPNIKEVEAFIYGRYTPDEASIMLANPMRGNGMRGGVAAQMGATPRQGAEAEGKLPLVHIIIPSDFRSTGLSSAYPESGLPRTLSYTWMNLHGGLDGIRITIPAMDVQPVADGLFPMNIQVKDPIWPLRNMLDFSFSVKPNQERVLWLDLRDRILPGEYPLYITLAGGGADFNSHLLEGARIELVFKEWEEAAKEHVADRFTQVRDNYAMITEEKPNNRRLNKYVQFERDMTDLFRVDPHHQRGREYWYIYNSEHPRPKTELAEAPEGVPEWAYYQTEYMKRYRHFIEWQIDNRQIENGEFGGGLSDDSDLGNWMPPLALMGVIPDKVEESLSRMMEACYNQGLLTGGMSTIQSDGLHTFEEGTNVIGQINLLRVGDPKEVERMMEAARSVRDHLIGVNDAGHTHFRSDYFSATKLAASGVWAWSSPRESLHLIPAIYLGEMYGHRESRQLVIDMADGFLAHSRTTPDGRVQVDSEINFETDESRVSGMGNSAPVFWAAWRWTRDPKYLKVLYDQNTASHVMTNVTSNLLDLAGVREDMMQKQLAEEPGGSKSAFDLHLAWQLTGDKQYLASMYEHELREVMVREYHNTYGSIWTDRFQFPIEVIQRARMGGIAQNRNLFYPGNVVSWRFDEGDTAENVAILIPYTGVEKPGEEVCEMRMEFFNLESRAIKAYMTGWDVRSGEWELVYGIDTDGDGRMDRETQRERASFGRGETVALTLAPRENVVIEMKLTGKGETVTDRPDLALGREDIRWQGNRLYVSVHNLGGTDAPSAEVALMDRAGNVLVRTEVPALKSAADLLPKRAEVVLRIPGGTELESCSVVIDPEQKVAEISTTNNRLSLSSVVRSR